MPPDHVGETRRALLARVGTIACGLPIYQLGGARAGPLLTVDAPPSADTLQLQAALDRRGIVRLDRTYLIDAPLTISGDTQLIGNRDARLVWRGPASQSILRDSSVMDAARVNRNITLSDFEIVGDNEQAGGSDQLAVEFYRTGNVIIRNIVAHDVGGSGIRWGNSYIDTSDILIQNCKIYNCRSGDALQGSGKRIKIINNVIGIYNNKQANFGDTGIALLTDFNPRTNPEQGYSKDVEIVGNTIIGQEKSVNSGKFSKRKVTTGIAMGPFANDHRSNITISNNKIRECYVNLWIVVMRGVLVSKNDFGPHGSPLTASARFDGVSDLQILGNKIVLERAPGGKDYSAIMINAQRNIFGSSTFDADVDKFYISNNIISSRRNCAGVILSFGQNYANPNYISKIAHGTIAGNTFIGVERPIVFAPIVSSNAGVCSAISIKNNIVDTAALSIVHIYGVSNQYSGMIFYGNRAPQKVQIRRGTGVEM